MNNKNRESLLNKEHFGFFNLFNFFRLNVTFVVFGITLIALESALSEFLQ
jgi:hypothetical protein